MKDRLIKKRVKVDYEAIIKMLDLSYDFTNWLFNRSGSNISMRRLAYAYLKKKKVCIEWCHIFHTKDNINTYAELLAFCGYNLKVLEDCCYEL